MQNKKTKKYYPLISIVTVNYNGSKDTCELIESLNKITYPNIEIIVVDNFSSEEDPIIIKRKFPNIILIKNPINYGFAAGNNFGIMKARGQYVLLLNNDTIVEPDFMEPLIAKLESDKNIGAVSPKLRYYYDPKIIQYAGYTPLNRYTLRNNAIGCREKDTGQYDKDYETAYAHGAAMMVPMDVMKKIGMMSYTFFLYYEEADWCTRIKKAGYKIYYVHKSLIYHKESMTTGKLSPMKIYYLNRNRIVFMRRNISGFNFIISILYQLLIAIPKNALYYLLKGKIKLFLAYYKAIVWNIKNMFNKEIYENPML